MITEAILNRAPVAPVRLNPDVPRKLDEIINKAIEKDRKLRYQTAADIRADLQRLKRDSVSGRTGAAVAESAPKPAARPLPWKAIAATAAVIALTAVGWLFFSRKAHALTERDTVVLADFTNTTGDPVFDTATVRSVDSAPFLGAVWGSDPADIADDRMRNQNQS